MKKTHQHRLRYNKETNTFFKNYPSGSWDIDKWWNIYQEYQRYDSRVVQVLNIDKRNNLIEMEYVDGLNCEKQLYNLDFNTKKKILIEVMDIFANFFKFRSAKISNGEIFFHKDFKTDNIYYTEHGVKLLDPDSFSAVPLDRMNNLLYFGRYTETLYDIKEKLSYAELDPMQVETFGRGYGPVRKF